MARILQGALVGAPTSFRILAAGLSGSLASVVGVAVIAAAAAAAEPAPLQPGRAVERALAGGETHEYSIHLEPGQFLRLVVDQRGIDVVTILEDPAGREILRLDSDLGIFGAETLCFVANLRGSHRIRVRAFEPEVSPGRYELRVASPRRASGSDRLRARASTMLWQAHRPQIESAADSLRRSDQHHREAARLWHDTGELREEAVTLDTYATFLRDHGDLRGAIVQHRKSLELARRVGDKQIEAGALQKIGHLQALLGDPRGGLGPLDSAISLSRTLGNRQREADSLTSKGWALYLLGRYQEALDCQVPALALGQSLRDRGVQAWAWNGLGNSYAALGESYQALRAFDNSCELFRRIHSGLGLSFCLQSAGFLSWQVGASRKALLLFQESLPLAVAAGNRAAEALIRNNIGLARMTLGELEPARVELQRALELWRSSGGSQGEALSLHNLGKVHELMGDRPLAFEMYGRALAGFRGSGDRGGEARVLATIAHCEAESALLDDAAVHIAESLAIFDALGRGVATPARRGSFLALRQNAYAIAVDILVRLDAGRPGRGFAEKAFQASERARAQTLLESLTEARLDLTRELPEDLRRRETELSDRLGRLQKGLAGAANRRGAEETIAAAEEEWEQLIGEIRRRTPRYASLVYPEPISVPEARSLLDPQTAIVSFSMTPDRVYAFCLTTGGVAVARLPVSPAALEEQIENYVGLISRDEKGQWTGLARRLSEAVVEPWWAGLPSGVRRLRIVPDGVLHSLLFESLPGRNGRLLLEDFVVSYAPSVTVLAAIQKSRPPVAAGPARVLAFANPLLANAVVNGVGAEERFDLEALPFAEAEGRAVVSFGAEGSELLVGRAASEQRVAQADLERFGVLHFATHGLLSSKAPSRSALVLAADPGGRENGLLTAREIYRLRLASDLVVLSGCRTARGRILPGDGVQSLARAFLHAGARSLVASLWDVSDRRTATLMESFYRHLAEGEPKADALRSAKLELLRREPNLAPRYWAPFVLVGDAAGTVPLRRVFWWRRLVASLLASGRGG